MKVITQNDPNDYIEALIESHSMTVSSSESRSRVFIGVTSCTLRHNVWSSSAQHLRSVSWLAPPLKTQLYKAPKSENKNYIMYLQTNKINTYLAYKYNYTKKEERRVIINTKQTAQYI